MGTEAFASYFKYCRPDEQVINGLFRDWKIRLTQSAALNDPLEANPYLEYPDQIDASKTYLLNGQFIPSIRFWDSKDIIQKYGSQFGILSLTKNPYSYLMWSHYAQGHTGFLVELGESINNSRLAISSTGKEYPVNPVEYSSDYSINLYEVLDSSGKLNTELLERRLFFVKSNRWRYEKEHRLVRPIKEASESRGHEPPEKLVDALVDDESIHLFDYDPDDLLTVTFGVLMKNDLKKRIMELLDGRNVGFMQAIIEQNMAGDRSLGYDGFSGRLRYVPLSDFPTSVNILDFSPLLFCSESLEELATGASSVELSRMEELPSCYDRHMPHLRVILKNKE